MLPNRAGLLCSAWFTDARVGSPSPFTPTAEAVFQPEGKIILPPLTGETPSQNLEAVLKTIYSKLGDKGKASMHKYIEDCGLNNNDVAMTVVREVFGDKPGRARRTPP